MSGRSNKSNRLSAEDRALWKIVADQVKPLLNHDRVTERGGIDVDKELNRTLQKNQTADGLKSHDADLSKTRAPGSKPRLRVDQRPTRRGPEHAKSSESAPNRGLNAFDPTMERRLRKGHEEIDARIDLHGMTQAQAHHALRAFLNGAVGRGYRNVLVITGKGRGDRAGADDFQARDTGVLRRSVPSWLAAADLAPIVVSYTQAHVRHGGAGALYVRLRAARKLSRK